MDIKLRIIKIIFLLNAKIDFPINIFFILIKEKILKSNL